MKYNNLDIVKAKPRDLSEIERILDTSQLPVDDLSESHLEHFFLLKKDGEVLGSIGLEIYGEHGLLRSLAVLQPARGKGFGKKLVDEIEEYGCEQNLKDIYLLTTTAEDFFSKIGYSKIPRKNTPTAVSKSEEFLSICPDSAATMIKRLSTL